MPQNNCSLHTYSKSNEEHFTELNNYMHIQKVVKKLTSTESKREQQLKSALESLSLEWPVINHGGLYRFKVVLSSSSGSKHLVVRFITTILLINESSLFSNKTKRFVLY